MIALPNNTTAYVTSIQFTTEDGWMLHYAWMYHAQSFEDAVKQAILHFNATQKGMLRSIHMTDGVNALYSRRDDTGLLLTQIVPLDMEGPVMFGPDTRAEEQNWKFN